MQLTSFRYMWWRSQLKLWTAWMMIFLAWPSVCWVGDVKESMPPVRIKQEMPCAHNDGRWVEGKKFCKTRGWRWENIHQGEGHSATHKRYFVMTQIAPSWKGPFLTYNLVFFTPKFPAWIIVVEHSQLHSGPWCSHKLPSPQWSQSLEGSWWRIPGRGTNYRFFSDKEDSTWCLGSKIIKDICSEWSRVIMPRVWEELHNKIVGDRKLIYTYAYTFTFQEDSSQACVDYKLRKQAGPRLCNSNRAGYLNAVVT